MKGIIFLLLGCLMYLPMFSQFCPQNVDHPGYKTMSQAISSDTIMREYILHIPSSYDDEKATPLVIVLHGFGGCAFDFSDEVGGVNGMDELSDKENFIIAYAQAAYRPEKDDVYWEPGDNGVSNIYENDAYFIQLLIAEINADFNVDLEKVFAAGYSNGGMMAYSLACQKGEHFAGVGIMSGAMLDDECFSENSIPIIKFHGIEDDVLPYYGNQWYQSVEEVISFWLDHNGIPSNNLISTQLNDKNVVRDEYFDGNDNSCVVLYTVHEEWDKPGGHVWFSEKINDLTPNEILWDFFSKGCSTISSSTDFSNLTKTISTFPNPVSGRLNIEKNNSDTNTYMIYNLHGGLEMLGTLKSKISTVDVSGLVPNVYTLQIGDQIIKFTKID